jgi:hypothetical protein
MAKEQTGNWVTPWVSRHRTGLLKLGAGLVVGLLAGRVVRRHDRNREAPSEFADAFAQRKMTWPGSALEVRKEQTPGLPPAVVRLSAVLGSEATGKRIISVSTDEELLMAQLQNVDGRPAVGWRREGGDWIFQASEYVLPTTERVRIDDTEIGKRRSLAAVWVGRQATEVAIGIAYTLEGGTRSFQPLDTGFEKAVHPWEISDNVVGDVPVFRPVAPPASGNNE